MTSAPELENETRRKFDEADRLLATMHREADVTARSAIDATPMLALVPPPVKAQLAAELADSVRETAAYGQAVTAQLRTVIVIVGDPGHLRQAALDLATSVSEQTSAIRASMEDQFGGLEAVKPENWDSHARANYDAAYRLQLEHLQQVDSACADLQAALNWNADAIESSWRLLLMSVIAIISAIATFLTSGLALAIALFFLGGSLVNIVLQFQADISAAFLEREEHERALAAIHHLTWPETPFSSDSRPRR
jgi:hypothetical protein